MPTELVVSDVQAVSSLEGVTRFFARLGYDVSNPAPLSAASLGITERVHHAFRSIQRIATHALGPGLPAGLEIYWTETTALTADIRKAVANAFRNKPAGTLVLMTTRDFGSLDFVMIERSIAQKSALGSQVAVSYRLLSVDRHNPADVHVRALERMRYKAADAYGQFDRIRDAFKLAEWSQDEFNNRNLFSDYFLTNRLRIPELFPEWARDVRSVHLELVSVLQRANEPQSLTADRFIEQFIRPILTNLGFAVTPADTAAGQADFLLRSRGAGADAPPIAALLLYPWDRPLDRKDDVARDPERAEDVPGIRVVNVLEHHKLNWAILTNGKDWRLYCAAAHSRASNYYEIDLPAVLEREDLTAFRYFYLFFRAEAFVIPGAAARGGIGEPKCFLDRVRSGSTEFAKEVGKRLREKVFDEVFPFLADGFVNFQKEKTEEAVKAGDSFLDETYDATLTLLYRLLFLLYAESLDLVPVHEPAYAQISLRALRQEIAEAAGGDTDTVEDRLKKRFNRTDTGLYQRLTKLFEVIDAGSQKHNMPAYNGGLFRTTPDKADASREAAAARFLKKHRVPDFFLARAIDLLARDEDTKTHNLVNVDYKALGVRQLGSIYEGLLMFHVVIPKGDEEKAYQRKGLRVALVPSNQKRKSTGSYFTPEHIVKYIVTQTVGPLLTEKFEAVAPKLREAQQAWRELRDFERGMAAKKSIEPRSDDALALQILHERGFESVVWGLFDLKVLDPAAGSGHFLVETVDYITDKILDFLAGFPWNPIQVVIEQRIRRQILESLEAQGVKINEDRLTDVNLIKRLVMKRCVYGVDLNPMAVELAKVSLWLDSFTLGAPLSFLDHHLKCGNSLIGSTIADLKKATMEGLSKTEQQSLMFAMPMEPLERATRNMELIADLTDATPAEVARSANTYYEVLDGVTGYRELLNCLTAENFGVQGARQLITEGSELIDTHSGHLRKDKLTPKDRRALDKARSAAISRAFFHWDVDFPDVFYTARRTDDCRAFDAVIGNPPYVRVVELKKNAPEDRKYFIDCGRFASATHVFDIYMLILELASRLVGPGGRIGFIIPIQTLHQDNGFALRKHLSTTGRWDSVVDLSSVVVFPEAVVKTCVLIWQRITVQTGNNDYAISIATPGADDKFPGPFEMRQWSLFSSDPTLRLKLERGEDYVGFISKIRARSRRLDEIYYPTFGLRPSGKESGGATKDELIVNRLIAKDCRPFCEAKDIDRYVLKPRVLYVRYLPDRMYSARSPELFEHCPKILVRALLSNMRLVATLDDRKLYADQTIVCCIPHGILTKPIQLSEGNDYPAGFLVACLNSAALTAFFEIELTSDSLGGGLIHATPGTVAKLPILRRDYDMTPEKEWVGDARRFSIRMTNPQSSIALMDVLGVKLCSLGNEKVELRRELDIDIAQKVETGSIGDWTGVTLLNDLDYAGWTAREAIRDSFDNRVNREVEPTEVGDGLGGIPSNLVARVYPSYPLPGIDTNAWEAAAWEEFCDLLCKNKGKIGNARIRADLTGRGAITNPTGPMRKLHETFVKYHREIRENRARAAEIDFLIDRIVFRLFDLTLDEQKLILSRVGPGRPLPPRRGKKRKTTLKHSETGPGLFQKAEE